MACSSGSSLGSAGAGLVLAPLMSRIAADYSWRWSWAGMGLIFLSVAPLAWQVVGVRASREVSGIGHPTTHVESRPAGPSAPVTRALYPASPPPHPLPGLRVERTVDRVTDEGIVGRLGDMPLQRYRRQSVQQVWLIDPQQGTRVGATVPRDEIVVVGVRPF